MSSKKNKRNSNKKKSFFKWVLIIFLVASIISRTGIAVSGRISAIIMTVFSAVGGIVSANKRR